jgi:hypothetical protein
MHSRRTRAIAFSITFVLSFACAESLVAEHYHQSSVLSVLARCGNVIDQPPPLNLGPQYGTFEIRAEAPNPPVASSATARLEMSTSFMNQYVQASAGSWPPLFISGSAFADVVSIVDITEQTTFDVRLSRVGLPDHFTADALIRVQGGPTVFSERAPWTMSPPPIYLTLEPGRYEVSFSGIGLPVAGTSGGGTGFFRLTEIPEPTGAAAVSLTTASLLCWRRRSGAVSNQWGAARIQG